MSPSPIFGGITILESPYLTQDGDPIIVRRTWRERLNPFIRPFRPFTPVRTIIPKVPYRGYIRLDSHTILMHPDTYRHLRTLFPEATVHPHLPAMHESLPIRRPHFIN